MEHFLHTAPPATAEPGANVVLEDHQPDYYKLLARSDFDPNVWFSAYVVSVDDHTSAGMTCWDQQFDGAFEKFADPKYGPIYAEEFRKVWPTFFELIDHAVDERYGEGALTEFIDPDDVNRKWFIAVLTRAMGSTMEDVDRRLEAADRAVELSLAVTREIQTKPGWKRMAKIGLRGGAVGYREGQALRAKWEGRLNWLAPLIGG